MRAPPESFKPMMGAPFFIAMSMILQIFCAWVWLTLPPLHVSASDIRARVAAGLDIGALVPPAVALYIRQQGLYRAATGS